MTDPCITCGRECNNLPCQHCAARGRWHMPPETARPIIADDVARLKADVDVVLHKVIAAMAEKLTADVTRILEGKGTRDD